MARWAIFVPLTSLLRADAPKVEIHNNEMWFFGPEQAKQLTRDGKAKLQALLSPSWAIIEPFWQS